MKTILSIALAAVLFTSQGCSKKAPACTDAELQQKLTNLDNQETVELSNTHLTSAQVTAIENKYDRERTTTTDDCK